MTQRIIERRWLGDYKVPKTEVRSDENGSKVITGHGAVFNRQSQNLGGFVEQVAPTAFNKTISEADVRALINHDANILLGRNKADTLVLTADGVGLRYDITPPDTTVARDWLVLLERGDISQSSFSFRAVDVDWGLTDDGTPLRTLLEVALYDVGPVTFPAYLDADAGVSAASRAAFADLAERRSEKLETVLELAEQGELRELIKDGLKQAPPSKDQIIVTTPKTDLTEDEKRTAAQTGAETRAIDPVAGSYEAVIGALHDAIEGWAKEQSGEYSWVYVRIDATFADRVVCSLYGGAWDYEGESFEFVYTADAAGKVTLGESKAVQLSIVVNDVDESEDGRSEADPESPEDKQVPLSVRKAQLALRERRVPAHL